VIALKGCPAYLHKFRCHIHTMDVFERQLAEKEPGNSPPTHPKIQQLMMRRNGAAQSRKSIYAVFIKNEGFAKRVEADQAGSVLLDCVGRKTGQYLVFESHRWVGITPTQRLKPLIGRQHLALCYSK